MSKLFFVVNDTRYFLSHRLPIVLATRNTGFEVYCTAKWRQRDRYAAFASCGHYSCHGADFFSAVNPVCAGQGSLCRKARVMTCYQMCSIVTRCLSSRLFRSGT